MPGKTKPKAMTLRLPALQRRWPRRGKPALQAVSFPDSGDPSGRTRVVGWGYYTAGRGLIVHRRVHESLKRRRAYDLHKPMYVTGAWQVSLVGSGLALPGPGPGLTRRALFVSPVDAFGYAAFAEPLLHLCGIPLRYGNKADAQAVASQHRDIIQQGLTAYAAMHWPESLWEEPEEVTDE